jgi:hypothetical protein
LFVCLFVVCLFCIPVVGSLLAALLNASGGPSPASLGTKWAKTGEDFAQTLPEKGDEAILTTGHQGWHACSLSVMNTI